ncbi:MAG: hypothetical protein R3C97_12945 [Geminicoccaceae bacterium]
MDADKDIDGRDLLRDEEGSVAAFMALAMLAFLGISALAIDLSRQATAEFELAHTTELACERYASLYRGNPEVVARKAAALKHFNAQAAALGSARWKPTAGLQQADGEQTIQAHATGSSTFARILGIESLSVVSASTCITPATTTAAPDGFLFEDGFEDVAVAPGQWDVVQNSENWRTTSGAGLEIQNGSVTQAPEGSNYAELDSHAGDQWGNAGKNTNSAITADILFPAGSFELRYFYKSRTNSASSNIIRVFLAPNGSELQTNMIDEAIFSSVWEERVVLFEIETPGTYHLTFAAGGKDDTYGGFIDHVRVRQSIGRTS